MAPLFMLVALVIALGAPLTSVSAHAKTDTPTITLTDLGPIGVPAAINNRDQIAMNVPVGVVDDSPISHAFLWERGTMTDLGTLGGHTSAAADINDRGQIVGFSQIDPNTYDYHPFLWERGKMIDLGLLPGGTVGMAIGINDRGQVVGWSSTAQGEYHAFLWEQGTMIDLGTFGGQESRADAINNRGQVVGWSMIDASGPVLRPFVWQDGRMTELASTGCCIAWAADINNHGDIVGYDGTSATLWQGDTTLTIPGLQGYSPANAINDHRQVVGEDTTCPPEGGTCDTDAFLWQNGATIYLDGLGGPYTAAIDINNKGKIVGISNNHAVIWTTR